MRPMPPCCAPPTSFIATSISATRTWARLRERFDDRQMMDIIFTVGQYTIVSMYLNSAGVQLEKGQTGIPR